MRISNANISKTVVDMAKITIPIKHAVAYGLSIGVLTFGRGSFLRSRSRSSSRSCTSRLRISLKRRQIRQTLLLPSNTLWHVFFQYAYLNFSSTHSKGQLGLRNGVSPNILSILVCIYRSSWFYLFYLDLFYRKLERRLYHAEML